MQHQQVLYCINTSYSLCLPLNATSAIVFLGRYQNKGMIVIPGWQWHVSRSTGNKEKAREVHELMDIDPMHTYSHMFWRSKTHDILPALVIGYCTDGMNGARNSLQHILDDQIYNAMFRKKSTEQETEE